MTTMYLSLLTYLLLLTYASPFTGSKVLQHGLHTLRTTHLSIPVPKPAPPIATRLDARKASTAKVDEQNWIERRIPLDIYDKEAAMKHAADSEEYDIGISGLSFETGRLSGKMYEAMMIGQDMDIMSNEIKTSYKMYAMDFTAREATKLALSQNGFEPTFQEEDMNKWGVVDSIQFIDPQGRRIGTLFDSWDQAVHKWRPGLGFNFVARQVQAKFRQMQLDEVLDSLDPDGSLRKAAEQSGMALPTEDIQSLRDLANEVARRCEEAPRESLTEKDVFKGTSRKGYDPIPRVDLLPTRMAKDGSENTHTLRQVMNALVVHGCLIVDIGNEAITLSKMWEATNEFFEKLDFDGGKESILPRMAAIEASPFAKLGYVNLKDGMKFMETRLDRDSGNVMPTELNSIVGEEGAEALKDSFLQIANIGKDVVRVATAASSLENKGFLRPSDQSRETLLAADIEAANCASLMVEELLDDGRFLAGIDGQGPVSMSPHRLCQYRNIKEDIPAEVFGAHTDSSFVTIVPVAAVSGLEVYDEEAEEWYRPELRARAAWEAERLAKGQDPQAFYETTIGVNGHQFLIPWHSRYVVVMPGEFLQVVTRNEIAAAVHRVVASGPARLSAPVLLRGRPGVKVDIKRYLGEINNKLLEQVDGMNMQEIHDALQPLS